MAWARLEPLVCHLRIYDDDTEPDGDFRHVLTVSRGVNPGEVIVSGFKADKAFERQDWRAISEALKQAGYTTAYFERHLADGSVVLHENTR
jgi:hypothetical protein